MPSRCFLKISDVMQVDGVGVIRPHGRSEAGQRVGMTFRLSGRRQTSDEELAGTIRKSRQQPESRLSQSSDV